MNLTISEIQDIIKVARSNPDMAIEDIILSTTDKYNFRTNIRTIASNITKIFENEPISMRPDLIKILKKCCLVNRQSINDVRSKSREYEYLKVRQQYCLIAVLFRYEVKEIGLKINRDHSTVTNAKKRALEYYISEYEYWLEMNRIINRFPKYKTTLFKRLEILLQ